MRLYFFIFANYFFMMREKLFIIIFILFSGVTIGQINEAGAFFGGSNYIGDIGSTHWIYPNSFAVGAVYKWNMHPRYSIRANYTYSKISVTSVSMNIFFYSTFYYCLPNITIPCYLTSRHGLFKVIIWQTVMK